MYRYLLRRHVVPCFGETPVGRITAVEVQAWLAGLRRCDIDTEADTLTVARKLSEVNGTLSFGPPKTAAGLRTVGIPSFVARSPAAHVDLYAENGAEGLVFPSVEGGPMRRSNFRRRVWVPATPTPRSRPLRSATSTSSTAGMPRSWRTSSGTGISRQHP